MINIEGPIGEEKDWIFYFTINDSNNNIVQSYEDGVSFFNLWKVITENFQKEAVFRLLTTAISNGNI
jgi:hypothetical protein